MNQLITALGTINPFRKPTAAQVAKTTLEDFERHLIVAESDAAYHRKMSEFYKEGILRLRQQAPQWPTMGT